MDKKDNEYLAAYIKLMQMYHTVWFANVAKPWIELWNYNYGHKPENKPAKKTGKESSGD